MATKPFKIDLPNLSSTENSQTKESHKDFYTLENADKEEDEKINDLNIID